MHNPIHHEDDRRGFRAARRFARHMGEGARFGRGGGGEGRGDWFRVGRMLAHGDLKLLALALIEEQPRHGYELIKLIEEKTSGCYSPSPGVVYPTLTFLEEAGYVTAESEGAKKRYSITEGGRAYLEENRDIADLVLARLSGLGKKMARMRRERGNDRDEDQSVPQLVGAALDNLRATAVKRLETEDDEAETKIVEILARAAQDIRKA
ncbi:MAG TPA: PadR family transcriptional regulator [Methyloceanibacter sp.]